MHITKRKITKWLDTWRYPAVTDWHAYQYVPNNAGDFSEVCRNCETVIRGRITNVHSTNVIGHYCGICGKTNTLEGIVLRVKEG
mgnify:CR=1 FL=1